MQKSHFHGYCTAVMEFVGLLTGSSAHLKGQFTFIDIIGCNYVKIVSRRDTVVEVFAKCYYVSGR